MSEPFKFPTKELFEEFAEGKITAQQYVQEELMAANQALKDKVALYEAWLAEYGNALTDLTDGDGRRLTVLETYEDFRDFGVESGLAKLTEAEQKALGLDQWWED